MDFASDASIISRLESSNCRGIYKLFCSHLHPFSVLVSFDTLRDPKNGDISSKSSKNQCAVGDPSLIRSLAKQYLSFLNRALSLLPKRLSGAPNPQDRQWTTELFDAYKLCLRCLECLSSQLLCKPYSVHLQRVRLIHCFEAWGYFEEAGDGCFQVLDSLRSINFGSSSGTLGKQKGELQNFLPDVIFDDELALMIVEIVVTIVKCLSLTQSKECNDYKRVVTLLDEVKPWFRVLDAKSYEKLHRVLVMYLCKCLLYLIGELMQFDGELVLSFCLATLAEYGQSSMKDQLPKIARRICSSLFSQQDNIPSLVNDIIICVLNAVACEYKDEKENSVSEYFGFISYCAYKCQAAETLCIGVAAHLNKIANDFVQNLEPSNLILRIYAIGLYFINSINQSKDSHSTSYVKAESINKLLLDERDRVLQLASLLGSLRSYFCSSGFFIASRQKLQSYLNALEFLCQPLAEFINLEKKEILSEEEVFPFLYKFCEVIQETFHQYCDVFFFCHSSISETLGEGVDGSNQILLIVALAAFTVSFRTKQNMQRSEYFIKHVISSDRVQPRGLRFLFASLYNVGVFLYKTKKLLEASVAINLSCNAAWSCVERLCQTSFDKSPQVCGELSEDAIIDLVSDVCGKSASLLDILYQCGSRKMNKLVTKSLEHWSFAAELFTRLSDVTPLVKQWVKIQCKLYKDVDEEDSAKTLYSLVSSSPKFSTSKTATILEQELSAYEDMSRLYSKLCHRMQMKIMDILLKDIYVGKDSSLEKSRIYVKKGRALRACGTEGLQDCIHCLSQAIHTLNDMYGDSAAPVSHQLAVAHCLRALCTQESEPNSKRIFQDIHAALNLWLNTPIQDHCSADDHRDMFSGNTMLLLYHIADLLSVKGHTDFHQDLYRLIIRMYKCKKIQLERCLAKLWEFRRVSHALCSSTVQEAVILILSECCSELSNTVDFWINSFRTSRHLLVGFQQCFYFLSKMLPQGFYCHESSFQSDIPVDEVKEIASELISRVPPPGHSVFVVGYLYYDLCERFISNGQLMEALSYAKEAHRLRSKLFQEKFMYSVEQQRDKDSGNGENKCKISYGLSNLQVLKSVASEIWSYNTVSWDPEDCILSPWNVLQCYLESTLQVGIIHEIIGNGAEAEALLLWGKNISSSQGLPLFTIAFSSVLGKVYRTKELWDCAEEELTSAKQLLMDKTSCISCLNCKLVMEVSLDQQIGDLYSDQFDCTSENPVIERLCFAENVYQSALDKLNRFEWGSSVCRFDKPRSEIMKDNGPNSLNEVRKPAKTKKASKTISQEEQFLVGDQNKRITRSRYRSLEKKNESTKTSHVNKRTPLSEIQNSVIDGRRDSSSSIPMDGFKNNTISSLIRIKWDFVRRQLSLTLLTSIGKCLGSRRETHKLHEVFSHSLSLLNSKAPFGHTYPPVQLAFSLDLVGKEIPGDVFAIERATTLYNISWFALKGYRSKETRSVCCELACIPIQNIVSWLMLAFILCRDIPVLFQKVSRLLAAIYLLSTTSGLFTLSPSSLKGLSENYWASYFHQVSVGIHFNHKLFASITGILEPQGPITDESSHNSGSRCTGPDTLNLLRLAPQSLRDLEDFVKNFFRSLPCTTVICLSLLGGAFASMLRDLLVYPSPVHAWMLLSRLNANNDPIIVLLPLDSILQEDADDDSLYSGCETIVETQDFKKAWHCPWGSTVVDDVAPCFRSIQEKAYLSSSLLSLEDTHSNRSLWWKRRKKLDHLLNKFLKDIEDTWMGPWKYLLVGELPDCKCVDSVHKKLVYDLKSKCNIEVSTGLLKPILGGAKHACEREEFASQLFLNKGCYIGRVEFSDELKQQKLSSLCDAGDDSCWLAVQLIIEASSELEEEAYITREPIILVLDSEVQMLPWENIPALRKQEVYRMPSVGSISTSLSRSRYHHQGALGYAFPLIDPLDAFYLLNPGGDLSYTQDEFENWFRDQNLEGKAGTAATAEELAVALQNHDLYIYFGHGSGSQYIPLHEIQKLKSCAATFLMGCSSGSLSLSGPYTPQGTPLSYLLAGSPIIIANLWDVTDRDIDRFGKAMLDAWLRERCTPSRACLLCNSIAKKMKSLHVNGRKENGKKKVLRKKFVEVNEVCKCEVALDHRPRIGSFMEKARDACTLPFLIGAAPVCYGIPTGITKRKEL